MAAKEFKCPSCNAPPNYKNSAEGRLTCPYCGSVYLNENANETVTPTPQPAPVNNINYGQPIKSKRPTTPRPKINVFLLVILLMFQVWPGCLYLVIKLHKQTKWDKENA